MSTALDIGVHRMRSLRRRHERVIGRRTRSVFAVLPDSASRRRVLERTRIPFATCDDSLLLMGDHAAEFGPSFHCPCLPLLPRGHVPRDDAPARQVLAALVNALLPEPVAPGEICCVAAPGDEHDVAFLDRVLRLQGYRPMHVHRGPAIVLSELVDRSFSGIGVDFGAGSTEIAVVHRGSEVARHVVSRGGDWIDARLAREFEQFAWDGRGHRHADADAIAAWKSDRGSILEPTDGREEFYGEVCTELVASVLEQASEAFAGVSTSGLPEPMTVVCSGGVTNVEGFCELVAGIWDRTDFPFAIDTVRRARDPEYAVARGCLISAELESSNDGRAAAA